MKQFCVYIMTNHSRTLYVGVTNNLERRVSEHKSGVAPGFTSKYKLTQLVFFEAFARVQDAILCEKQIKGWTRAKKLCLIEAANPGWHDLSEEWFVEVEADALSSKGLENRHSERSEESGKN